MCARSNSGKSLCCPLCISYMTVPNQSEIENSTTAFSQVHAAILISELISIPLGAALIAVDPWIPILSALYFSAITTLITLFFTLKYAKFIDSSSSQNKQSSDSDDGSLHLSIPVKKRLWDRWSQSVSNLATNVSPWLNVNVVLMLVSFFFCQLGRQFSSVLIQYCSYKFKWDYATVSTISQLGIRRSRTNCHRDYLLCCLSPRRHPTFYLFELVSTWL